LLLYDALGANPFGGLLGTPSAYLLDTEGQVAAPLALGAQEVPALARDAASSSKRPLRKRSLSESRIMRDGLPADTPAPTFALPGIDGDTVSLEDYRGTRVLLVFSDPDCGPCNELAPELARLHGGIAAGRNLAFVMIARGDEEANRVKRAEHGIRFPVATQPGWKLSKRYGIFSTPVAFVIDEQGVIAHNVAIGIDAILAMARSELTAGKEVRVTV
jgi:peroxiredoxin